MRLEESNANPEGARTRASAGCRGLKEMLRLMQDLAVRERIARMSVGLDGAGRTGVVHVVEVLGLLWAVPLAEVGILSYALRLGPAHLIERCRVREMVI